MIAFYCMHRFQIIGYHKWNLPFINLYFIFSLKKQVLNICDMSSYDSFRSKRELRSSVFAIFCQQKSQSFKSGGRVGPMVFNDSPYYGHNERFSAKYLLVDSICKATPSCETNPVFKSFPSCKTEITRFCKIVL